MSSWVFFSLAAALLWSIVNHLDKFLLSKYCQDKDIGGLVIFSGIIAFPVVVTIAIFYPQIFKNINSTSTLLIVTAGIIYMIGIIPYLHALKDDETSAVVPQMLMIPVFALIFGYIFLEETLNINQFLGSITIILGALLISSDFKDIFNTKFNSKTFFIMLLYSMLVAITVLIFKFVALETSFISTIFWLHIGYCIVTIFIVVFMKNHRNQFISLIRKNRNEVLGLNILGEILTLSGNISFQYATYLVPIAVADTAAEGTQPLFVLIIGALLTKLVPNVVSEDLDSKKFVHKLISIVVMIVGFFLIATSTKG